MNKIDTQYDEIIGSNYELYSIKLSELKELAKSWYGDINFRAFDERFVRDKEGDDNVIEMKKTGVICNFFFAYQDGDEFYLLDGFNRLFTNYGNVYTDSIVYLKILTDKLEDHQLVKTMFHLNMWKLQKGHGYARNFNIEEFLDRGFKLLLYKKFGIEFYKREKQVDKKDIYDYNKQKYEDRLYNSDDIELIKYYFRRETQMSGDFGFELSDIAKLFSHKNIIVDIKEIIKTNKYKTPPFKNYEMFFEGFIMFLAWRRVSGDESEYKFNTYLNKLREDKKFFKKLQGMSGTDSTRINIYKFFRELYKK